MDRPPTNHREYAAAWISVVVAAAMEKTGAANMAELTKLLNAQLGPGNEISRNTLDNWRRGRGQAARLDAAFALLNMADMLSIEPALILMVQHPELATALPRRINLPQIIAQATALQQLWDSQT